MGGVGGKEMFYFFNQVMQREPSAAGQRKRPSRPQPQRPAPSPPAAQPGSAARGGGPGEAGGCNLPPGQGRPPAGGRSGRRLPLAATRSDTCSAPSCECHRGSAGIFEAPSGAAADTPRRAAPGTCGTRGRGEQRAGPGCGGSSGSPRGRRRTRRRRGGGGGQSATMCAGLRGELPALALLLLLARAAAAAGTEATRPPEGQPERTPQQKGRLSLQNTGTAAGGRRGGSVGSDSSEPPGTRGRGRAESFPARGRREGSRLCLPRGSRAVMRRVRRRGRAGVSPSPGHYLPRKSGRSAGSLPSRAHRARDPALPFPPSATPPPGLPPPLFFF